ncbi:unnamed protein product [Brassica oleracea]
MQNTLIQEGKEMASILYTYRSCVKALPQVPVYAKFRDGNRWLQLECSTSLQLAADMRRSSRP